MGLVGAAWGSGFSGVGSRGVFIGSLRERLVFAGMAGLAGVLATAAYDFVVFPDSEGCALSVGGVRVGIKVGRRWGVSSSGGAGSSVGMDGGGSVWWVVDGVDGATSGAGVVVGVFTDGLEATPMCGWGAA